MAQKPVTVQALRKAINEITFQQDPIKRLEFLKVAIELSNKLSSDELMKMPPMQGESEVFRVGIISNKSLIPSSEPSSGQAQQLVSVPQPKSIPENENLTWIEAAKKADQAQRRLNELDRGNKPEAAEEKQKVDYYKELAATKLATIKTPRPEPGKLSGDKLKEYLANIIIQGIRTAGEVVLGHGAGTIIQSESLEQGRVTKQIDSLMDQAEKQFENTPQKSLMNDIREKAVVKALNNFASQNIKEYDKVEDRDKEVTLEKAEDLQHRQQTPLKTTPTKGGG